MLDDQLVADHQHRQTSAQERSRALDLLSIGPVNGLLFGNGGRMSTFAGDLRRRVAVAVAAARRSDWLRHSARVASKIHVATVRSLAPKRRNGQVGRQVERRAGLGVHEGQVEVGRGLIQPRLVDRGCGQCRMASQQPAQGQPLLPQYEFILHGLRIHQCHNAKASFCHRTAPPVSLRARRNRATPCLYSYPR